MTLNYAGINWLAIVACVVVGQVFLTAWFAVLFAKPWARVYGVNDPKQHTREIPGYTYAIGAACVLLLSLGLATLQGMTDVATLGDAVSVGLFVAIHFAIAAALPGYAFLRRWSAFMLAIGSQTVLIVILSAILVAWQ